MAKTFLTKAHELPAGRSRTFNVDGRRVLVVNAGGGLRAYRNFCPHMGGTLRYNGCDLKCEWHGSLFDIESGEPKTPPATGSGPLDAVTIVVEGDDVYCDLPEEERSPWADDF